MSQNRPYYCSSLSPDDIIELAEKFATRFGFTIGQSLLPIVTQLGGQVVYAAPHEMSDMATLQLESTADGVNFTICLSSFLSPLQERFAIAHELGHYVLHSVFGKNKDIFAQSDIKSANRMELQANFFAEAFLIPKDKVREFNSLIEIAGHFKVPIAVANSWTQYISKINEM